MKRFKKSLDGMSDAAFCLFSGCLKTACAMLLCAFALLVHIGTPTPSDLRLWLTAQELCSCPAGILLVGVLGAAILEERSRL